MTEIPADLPVPSESVTRNGPVAAGEGTMPAPDPLPARRQPKRRHIRSLLPTGANRVLRFSGRDRGGIGSERRNRAREDELHRALGRIAANWSLIEIASGFMLMGILGSPDESLARAVVAGQRVENVWETTEAMLAAYGEVTADELALFRSWRRSANAYRRRRNEAIHSAWSLTSGGGSPAAWDVMSQRAKRGARVDLFPGGVEELEDLASDIAACEEQLNQVHLRILGLLERQQVGRVRGPAPDGR